MPSLFEIFISVAIVMIVFALCSIIGYISMFTQTNLENSRPLNEEEFIDEDMRERDYL